MDYPGEKLVVRLWETIEKGGVGLLGPWQTRRMAQARIDTRRSEALALVQLERDVRDIRSGRKNLAPNNTLVDGSELDNRAPSVVEPIAALAEAAQRRLIVDQMRAEVNVAKAVSIAEADLSEDEQEPPDHDVDDDWLHRWRDSASRVTAEEDRPCGDGCWQARSSRRGRSHSGHWSS